MRRAKKVPKKLELLPNVTPQSEVHWALFMGHALQITSGNAPLAAKYADAAFRELQWRRTVYRLRSEVAADAWRLFESQHCGKGCSASHSRKICKNCRPFYDDAVKKSEVRDSRT